MMKAEILVDRPLTLAEELHVLLLDRQGGGLIDADDRKIRYAFAGAGLMNLARERRIDTDLENLTVLDSTPLGDDILDPLLAAISGGENTDIVYWIERFSGPEIANRIRRRAGERLIHRGIFNIDPGGTLFLDKQVSLTRRYPGIPLPEGQDVVLRVMNVIFSEDIPSPDEAMLVALVDVCGIFGHILAKPELAERRDRIALVSRLDLIGLSVRNAILAVREPDAKDRTLHRIFQESAAGGRRKCPPMAPMGLPLIGHSLRLRPFPTQTLADYYRSLGPIFRIRDLASTLTVLAGPEANLFLQKRGRALLRSHKAYTPLFEGMDAQRIILSMDGEEHFSLRRAISSGFSRDRYLNRLPEIRDIILSKFPENGNAVAIDTFSHLTAKSIGLACTNYVLSNSEVKDMDFFLRRLIAVTVLRALPKFMMYTPRMKRAKAGFFDIFTNILRARLDDGTDQGKEDVVDAMLELHRSNPQFLPEQELRVSCLGPIFSGLHTTASTGTFALYLLLKHPGCLERVRVEADELYANGGPTPEKMKALDVTRRTVFETLRIYNPFGFLFRHAVNSFDFGGYTIPAGTALFLPTSVPHYCPEFFREPDRFDIDRYLPERAEHSQPGVYMPFGFGTHRCLGSTIAENHLMFTLATILHHRNVSMDPPDYKMKMIFDGVPAPTRKLRLKLTPR
ncbi:MAG: cytochrome P450 [Nitrospira sp. SB0677_bin_15]|nr:cytochrome P450 [Nitrospira sp. SB0667_bin_9]MYD30431.1 cytochrome P450 [Nitrospira sp. SB0661_bin_20]MYG39761.1 cytochrome P450 [Nitrospira sp. SB0677_bin_15]MYJ22984.1 cytochrome P450 [Nitrospira sp. SB0673_bin_12]